MQIEMKNYRGCEKAVFLLNLITMIGGKNAAGKSSIAQAVAAALTGNPLPVRGITKNSAGQLVRSGTASGSIWLAADDGQIDITWPNAKVKTTGTPPAASEYATGLACILNMDKKKRSAALADYLKAEPTRDDFNTELKSLGLPEKLLDQLWEVIQTSGWDGAHANCKDKGARLKGQWEQITGDRYGSKKAENWIPDGWEPNLEASSEDALQDEVNDARQVLEAAIAAEAIDDNKCAELEELADQIPGLKEEIEVLEGKARKEGEKLAAVQKELRALPLPHQVEPLVCPECATQLNLNNGKLEPAKMLSADEVYSRQEAITEKKAELDDLQEKSNESSKAYAQTKNNLRIAQNAAGELEGFDKQNAAGELDIEGSRNQLQFAESRLQAFKQKTEADNRHTNISLNAELISALAPDGIRQTKLGKAISDANKAMFVLSNISGFGTVEIDSDLEASLNGTPYHLLSKSERWRVRVLIQLWMAETDSSAAVIIDGADILVDRDLRNGLIGLLRSMNIPALVTMALSESDALPNLGKAKVGESHWIEDGVLKSMNGGE